MFNLFKNISYQIISPKAAARSRYEAFRELLEKDQLAHVAMAELEEVYYQKLKVDLAYVASRYAQLSQTVSGMIGCLERMAPSACANLQAYFKKIDFYCRFALAPPEIDSDPPFILPLDSTYADDKYVGGKAYNLALLSLRLGLPVPQGFIVSTSAYHYIVEENNLRASIDAILAQIDIYSNKSLAASSAKLVQLIDECRIPKGVVNALERGVDALQQKCGSRYLEMAVRSSAVGEDSKISFAGQYESRLHVTGETIVEAYKNVLKSKFSERALFYRIAHGFADHDTPMAVLVLEMIDPAISGVMLTSETGDKAGDTVEIHYVPGHGEQLVSGRVSPATIRVSRDKKQHESKQTFTAKDKGISISDDIVRQLTDWASQIHTYYDSPQEIEWCQDKQGDLFILQSRYYRTNHLVSRQKNDMPDVLPLFQGGERAASGAASGLVHVLDDLNALDEIPDGAVLVTKTTPPSLARICHRLAAVIADEGSAADHFASVAREWNIPTLVKTGNCTKLLAQQDVVTVNADMAAIYPGKVKSLLKNSVREKEESRPLWHSNFGIAISFISPLRLTNPADQDFLSGNCRSHHDIVRYVHENAIQSMFGLADHVPLRKGGARLLKSSIPLQLYILDIGGGLAKGNKSKTEIGLSEVHCVPLLSLWEGLTHTGILWQDRAHFDWGRYDDIIMAGGVVSPKSMIFASYGIVSQDYLNLNMRFGYHFALLDTLIPLNRGEEKHISLRFAGGGAGVEGKHYRLTMINKVLSSLQFETRRRGDMLDGRYVGNNRKKILKTLDLVGRLLGATRVMDMILTDEAMAVKAADEFLDGRYNFSKE